MFYARTLYFQIVQSNHSMNQAAAKELIKSTDYLDNQILAYKEDSKLIYGKIVWKGYTASFKDDQGEDGTVRVRIKNLHNSEEFSESLTKIVRLFPKDFMTNRSNSKKEILNVLQVNKDVKEKTLSWIGDSISIPETEESELETLLTELWLESKVVKARFTTTSDVVYNSKA